ncbi:cytochrome P450 [Hymenopellis radicata]|nr:cytochrome P450 [Hymenopellis radicata]
MSLSPNLQLFAVALVALAVLRFLSRRKNYPPGPPRYPFIGNLFNRPSQLEWQIFAKWSEELDSDIVHMDVFGKSIVILNSQKAVFDLFSKKGSLYSGRPSFVMANELMGWARSLTSNQYNEEWRQQRRHFHQEFNEVAARRFFPVQTKAVHGLLRQFLESPDDFMAHIKHMAATIILSVAYGLEIQPKDDPLIKLSDDAVTPASDAGRPGAYLVDVIEPLKYIPEWFPGAGFKRKARLWRQLAHDMWNVPWDMTKQQIALGIAAPSFVSSCLDALNHSDSDNKARDEYHIQSAAGSMYAAGVDTTMGAVGFFLLAMVQFPEAQAKAQAEIDMVLGHGHLPTFDDMESLPYVTALVREVLRCNPPGPIGVPHTAAKDDVYRNYFIPKGAFVISNLWAISHDPVCKFDRSIACTRPTEFLESIPRTVAFKPERYMGPDGKLDPAVKDPSDVVFGIGRRICPARILGYNSTWISVASILAAFDIKPDLDSPRKKLQWEQALYRFQNRSLFQ